MRVWSVFAFRFQSLKLTLSSYQREFKAQCKLWNSLPFYPGEIHFVHIFLFQCGTCGMIWGRVVLWCFIPLGYCRTCQCICGVRAVLLLSSFCPQKYPPFFLSVYWVSNKLKTWFLLKEGFYFCKVLFCVVGGSLLKLLFSWKDKVALENFRRELIAN